MTQDQVSILKFKRRPPPRRTLSLYGWTALFAGMDRPSYVAYRGFYPRIMVQFSYERYGTVSNRISYTNHARQFTASAPAQSLNIPMDLNERDTLRVSRVSDLEWLIDFEPQVAPEQKPTSQPAQVDYFTHALDLVAKLAAIGDEYERRFGRTLERDIGISIVQTDPETLDDDDTASKAPDAAEATAPGLLLERRAEADQSAVRLGLQHTRVLSAELDGRSLKPSDWNDVALEMVREALRKLPDPSSALSLALARVHFVKGPMADHNYVYVPDIDLSVRKEGADRAWLIAAEIAGDLGCSLNVQFIRAGEDERVLQISAATKD